MTNKEIEILKIIKLNENMCFISQQINDIAEKMKCNEKEILKLHKQIVNLSKHGFIENLDCQTNNSGISIGADGFVTYSDGSLKLTPDGLGYIETYDLFEQILLKAINKSTYTHEQKINIKEKMINKFKENGLEIFVDLTFKYLKEILTQ